MGTATFNSRGADEVQKRMVSHMNDDHSDSLVRYVEHYCSVPSWHARHARLLSIASACLTLSLPPAVPLPFIGYFNTETYRIPLDPPLRALDEVRPRLVTMDQDALAGLQRHPVTVKTYKLPRKLWQITIMTLSISVYLALNRRRVLIPGQGNEGGPLLRQLAVRFQSLFSFLHWAQPKIFWPLIALHLIEAIWIHQRLRRHSVPLLSPLWWKWIVSTFLEGYGAICRLDEMVAAEEARRNKQRH